MLLVLLLLTFSSQAQTSLEIVGGSITYHLINPGDATQFSNKMSADGKLIHNPLIGIQEVHELKDEYWSLGVFVGENSIGQDIAGFKYSTGEKMGHWYIGFVIGAYEQSSSGFYDKGIVPFQVAKIDDTGIVPVVGVELNYKIVLTRDSYLKLNNIVSPAITNSSISLGFSF